MYYNKAVILIFLLSLFSVSSAHAGDPRCSGDAVVVESGFGASSEPVLCEATSSITTQGDVRVESGADVTFQADQWIRLMPGFHAEHSSVFTATIRTFEIATSGGGNGGTVTPSTINARFGEVVQFTLTPDPGNAIGSISGCPGVLSGSVFTTEPITGDCTLAVSFVPLTLSLADASVIEGDTGITVLAFSLTLSAPAYGDVTVDYATSDDTATSGSDYVAVSDSLLIPSGTSSGIINVDILGDLAVESNEVFILTLSHVSENAALQRAVASGTIIEDDVQQILNDTGITDCGDGNNIGLTCPISSHPGQDAESGRDADPATNSDADGRAGFSYLRVGADGLPLAIQDGVWDPAGDEQQGTRWSCVHDNVTGLLWEVKLADGSYQDTAWTYTWYGPDTGTNGGDAGTQAGGDCGDTLIAGCDTAAYVDAINAQALCGHTDWRLPTRKELLQLIDNSYPYGESSNDPNWFPNGTLNWVWSSTASASDSASAWSVANGFGSVYEISKDTPKMIRVVRGGR